MAMNPMQKKARTSFLLGMFLTLIITGLIIGFLILQLSKIQEEQASIVYQSVYVVNNDIQSGEVINGKIAKQEVRAENVPSNAITDKNFVNFITDVSNAKIAIRRGTVLTTDMINIEGKAITADVRIQEYNMLVLPTQLEEGNCVDIRFRLPTGEDYIVLSKKMIEQANSDTIWIKVAEEEILTMSNAIVENYIVEGSLLYATTYADAGMQGESSTTYIPSERVRHLMSRDINIVTEAYSALQEIYGRDISSHRTVINEALQGYGDQALTNVETDVGKEIEKMQTARQQYVDGLSTY